MHPTRPCRCHMGLLGLAPAWVLVPATFRKPPSSEFTVNLIWFVSVAEPTLPGPQLAVRRLHHGEGTFLSVVHCQQPSCSLNLRTRSYEKNPPGKLNSLGKLYAPSIIIEMCERCRSTKENRRSFCM